MGSPTGPIHIFFSALEVDLVTYCNVLLVEDFNIDVNNPSNPFAKGFSIIDTLQTASPALPTMVETFLDLLSHLVPQLY